jgi:hypothetical protein
VDAVPYLLLIALLVAAVLAVFATRRGDKPPPVEQPRVDPSAVRPEVYVEGRAIADRRREPRPLPRTSGLRQEPSLDDGGAVAFVPPPAAAPRNAVPTAAADVTPPASPTRQASSPEDLGIDLSAPIPPRPRAASPGEIDFLPPERAPGD